MALITDPDLLLDEAAYTGATEVFINPATKTIRLTKVGDLSDDGVTLKCLYSFLKEEWRLDPHTKNLAAFPFPMTPITDESFEVVDGWNFYDDTARYLLRTAGWTVKNTSGQVTEKWAGIIGLGAIEANDQLYYQQVSGGASTNVVLTGQINQAVQILSDPNGDGAYGDGFDRRTYFALFAREYEQLYGKATLTDIGVSSMDSQAYRFPIGTGADAIKVVDTDVNVAANSPFTQIAVRYFDQAFSRDVDSSTNRSFGIVVDVGTHSGVDGSAPGGASVLTTAEGGMTINAFTGGVLTLYEGTNENQAFPIVSNTATTITVTGTIAVGSNMSFTAQRATPVVASAEEIYTKVQYLLRQAADMDATDQTVSGKVADQLMYFVGDTLVCGRSAAGALATNPNGGGGGVFISGFATTDTNRLTFYDASDTPRTFPYVAALTINFGDNLKNDASAKYWVYFTNDDAGDNTGRDFGTATAIIVDDNAGADMAGDVSGVSSVQKSFNYDGNIQRGVASAGDDAPITVIGIGLATGQYVKATGTIQRSIANSISLVAALERNYQNV